MFSMSFWFYFILLLYLVALPTVLILISEIKVPERRVKYRQGFLTIWFSIPFLYLAISNIEKVALLVEKWLS